MNNCLFFYKRVFGPICAHLDYQKLMSNLQSEKKKKQFRIQSNKTFLGGELIHSPTQLVFGHTFFNIVLQNFSSKFPNIPIVQPLSLHEFRTMLPNMHSSNACLNLELTLPQSEQAYVPFLHYIYRTKNTHMLITLSLSLSPHILHSWPENPTMFFPFQLFFYAWVCSLSRFKPARFILPRTIATFTR